ncbi:hypothetical protein ACO2Q8_12280 [Larkinella sp. VNQ87]|uniref:hypothetical protein n=1 Tax=Larkinella sp. VNQ87 TaxID=3400921 RepID=UPI003BFDCE3C
MHKIVAAVNSMIANPNLISTVIKSVDGNELFFTYEDRFKWSVTKSDEGHYYLYYYPGNVSIQDLATIPEHKWTSSGDFITYSSKEIKTKEAYESFAELYQIVQGKLYGIDDVLDYIIKTAA